MNKWKRHSLSSSAKANIQKSKPASASIAVTNVDKAWPDDVVLSILPYVSLTPERAKGRFASSEVYSKLMIVVTGSVSGGIGRSWNLGIGRVDDPRMNE